MSKIDIARALKDKTYFNSLSTEEQQQVRSANPAGNSELSQDELDSVAGGLAGGDVIQATTTTTAGSCSCKKEDSISPVDGLNVGEGDGSCACNC